MCASGSAKTHYLRSKVKKLKQNNDKQTVDQGRARGTSATQRAADLATAPMTDVWVEEKEIYNDFFCRNRYA